MNRIWSYVADKEIKMPRIFIFAPMRSDFDDVRSAIHEGAAEAGRQLNQPMEWTNVGAHENVRSPTDATETELRRSDLVVAEVSAASRRLIWDLGFAQALGKLLILLTTDISTLPLDIRDVPTIVYEDGGTGVHSLIRVRVTEALIDIFGARSPAKKGAQEAKSVFVSYSHADSEFLKRILIHLRPLERRGLIDLWSDDKIRVGDRWRDEIRGALEPARVAILLISADFLASEFIVTNELPPLLAAAEERGTRIIPVIVKPSRFMRDDQLARFQALNDPAVPVIRMTEDQREDLYARLAEVIETDFSI